MIKFEFVFASSQKYQTGSVKYKVWFYDQESNFLTEIVSGSVKYKVWFYDQKSKKERC